MRAAFLALLLVNLMFLAWTEWIDVPVLPPNAIAGLPRLRLATEAQPRGPNSNSSAVPASQAPAAMTGAAEDREGAEAASSAQFTPASQPAGAALAAKCVSVGPFESATGATQASQQLGGQNFSARQRVVQSPPTRWYWVYLPSAGSDSQMNRLLRRLSADGIEGAKSLRAAGKQRISLGMFQDPKLAARQQRLAQRKGFQPVLAEHLASKAVYWLDLWVPGGAQALPLEALKAGAAIGTQSCPAGETPPESVSQAVSPGLPAPQAKVTGGPSGP